jgi:cellulose synthase/poly-beta-1,6-N-acetylglucosamine synthase-like glycosyltransferase
LDQGFDDHVKRFLNQDYPDYQVVFAVASGDDAAYKNLCRGLGEDLEKGLPLKPRVALVVAGLSEQRGEKVHNLLRGIEAVDPAVEVLVFADIDASPSPDWLRSLVAPLADSRVTVSTGFRWYLPGAGFVSRLRAAWDTSIASLLGDPSRNPAWGGSTAIRRSTFRELAIAERHWASTVSDDLSLTRAVREAGGTIAFESRCLVASREESSLPEFLRWSTRQVILSRVYSPFAWKVGLTSQIMYCLTLVFGLVVLALRATANWQRVAVLVIWCGVILLGVAKGYIRSIVTAELFPTEVSGRPPCYWNLAPLVSWVMIWNFVTSGLTRRIEWRGTEYELVSAEKIRVVRRRG